MRKLLPVGLYIHYPWCVRKCPYCDFNSYPIKDRVCMDDAYTEALIADFYNVAGYLEGRRLISVYFGGGTPSLFPPERMSRILKAVEPYLEDDCEISMEANPGTLSLKRLCDYKALGVNRISLGVQSFNDESLRFLGRIHDADTAVKSAADIIRAGFDNFNIDLMHGLPSQSVEMSLSDIKRAHEMGANHLSWYELTIEEGTAFGDNPPPSADEDVLFEIEDRGFRLIDSLGYKRYEVSGYTKDRRCVHNQNYWYFNDYLGIGAGAHSKLKLEDGTYRRALNEDPLDYIREVKALDNTFVKVDMKDLPFEFMLNRLRIFDRIHIDEFKNTTDLEFSCVKEPLLRAQDKGLLLFKGDFYELTALGRIMLNDILQMFL